MKPYSLGAGTFPDVAWWGGTWYLAYQPAATGQRFAVLCRLDGEAWTVVEQQPCSDLAFCRLMVTPIGLAWAWRGVSGAPMLWQSWQSGPWTLPGMAYGNSPVCLGAGWLAWQPHAGQVQGVPLAVPIATPTVLREEGRPTGLSRLIGNGGTPRVQFIDEDRAAVSGMLNPVWAGDVVVGEGAGAGLYDLARRADGLEARVWPGQDSQVPRLATDGAGRYAVTAWGQPGVRVAILEPGDFVPPVVVQPPPPVPTDPLLRLPAPDLHAGPQDMLDWFLGGAKCGTRHGGSHTVRMVTAAAADGREPGFCFMKGDNPSLNREWYWYDDALIYHHEDWGVSAEPVYGFRSGDRIGGDWALRSMCVGDVVRFEGEKDSFWEDGSLRASRGWMHENTLLAVYRNVDLGGELGVRDLLCFKYDPTIQFDGPHGSFEYGSHAAGASTAGSPSTPARRRPNCKPISTVACRPTASTRCRPCGRSRYRRLQCNRMMSRSCAPGRPRSISPTRKPTARPTRSTAPTGSAGPSTTTAAGCRGPSRFGSTRTSAGLSWGWRPSPLFPNLPTRDQVRLWRGDFCGPDVDWHPKPLFSIFYVLWSDEHRASYRAWCKKMGYTHVDLSIAGQYPADGFSAFDLSHEPEKLREFMIELLSDDLIPAVHLLNEEVIGNAVNHRVTPDEQFEAGRAVLARVMPVIKDVLRAAVVAWEANDFIPGNPGGNHDLFVELIDEYLDADVMLYDHWTPEHGSAWDAEGDYYQWAAGHHAGRQRINGILYQASCAELRSGAFFTSGLVDWIKRFNDPGYTRGGCPKGVFDFVYHEGPAQERVPGKMTEAEAIAFGDRMRATGVLCSDGITRYVNGTGNG